MEPVMAGAMNGKDRGESIGLMEPLLVPEGSRHRTGLTDLAVELAARSAGFRRSLPARLAPRWMVAVREPVR